MALILALVVFLLLGNTGPEQVEQTLDKRGASEGEADSWKDVWGSMPEKLKHTLHKRGDKDFDVFDIIGDGHTTLQNGWGTVPDEVNDQLELARTKIPGPKTEPPFEPCNRKDWVMWLSFGAPHEEFWSHREAKDISCLKDADWKSDACTGAVDRSGIYPTMTWDFKIACQRGDFARLNLPDFRSAFREEMGSMVKFDPFIKQRFAKDLFHMCNKQHFVSAYGDSKDGDAATRSKRECYTHATWYLNENIK